MVQLEGPAAVQYSQLLSRLIQIARPGALYPDGARLAQLLEICARVAPRQEQERITLLPLTGLPPTRVLEKLEALRAVAAEFMRVHGTKPTRTAHAYSIALAAAELPPVTFTQARLVSKQRGERRFLVVHERWAGPLGCPTRFTLHLTDRSGRYVGLDKTDQAKVEQRLKLSLEVACSDTAESAFLQLCTLDGVEVAQVVMGQLGPFEAPGLFETGSGLLPLRDFLKGRPADGGLLHLVLERAATDVSADASRDPFAALDSSPEAQRRRTALGFHVSRERRICCSPMLEAPLRAHFAGLGAAVLVRAK